MVRPTSMGSPSLLNRMPPKGNSRSPVAGTMMSASIRLPDLNVK